MKRCRIALARVASSSGSSSEKVNSVLGAGSSTTMASWSGSIRSRRMPLFSESSSKKEPAVGPGALAGKGWQGWWEDAGFEPRVLVVPRLPGAARVTGRGQHALAGGRELHLLACGQQRPCRLLARDHEMSEPWRQSMACIVLHGAELGRDAECIRDPLGCALVVGRKGDPDMAIIENRIVRPICLLDLVQ